MQKFKEKTEWIFWSTIGISFSLLVHNGVEPIFLVAYSAVPFIVLHYYYKRSPWLIIVYLLIFGILGRYTRYFRQNYASDVLPTIADFIGYFIAGKSVYSEMVFSQTGLIPFVYLPFSLFWYLPARILNIDFRFFEMIVSSFVPFLFFICAYLLNRKWESLLFLSVLSLTPFLLDLSADGSNDNSAIFLLLVSVVFLFWAKTKNSLKLSILSAVLLGIASSFKHYTFFYLFFFSFFMLKGKNFLPISGIKYLFFTYLVIAIINLPFFLTSPSGFIRSFTYLEFVNHSQGPVWGWNIWVALKGAFDFTLSSQQMWMVRTSAMLATLFGIFKILKVDKINKVFVASSVSILVYLVFSQWTTYAYFSYLIPLFALSSLPHRPDSQKVHPKRKNNS